MRVLVTGGAGFIGSHIVDRLLAEGHAVCVVDNLSTGLAANIPAAATFKQSDICETAPLRDAFASFKPEVVFHLAAQMDVRRSVLDPDFDARVNVLGALAVLRTAVAVGVRRLVYASTGGAIYGNPSQLPVTESYPPEPVSEYGASKLAFEHYLSVYGIRGEIEYASLRYPNVFGPRQRPDGEAGVIAIFTGLMLRGDQPKLYGDGKKTRDYLYVADVVEANIRAMTGPAGVTANLGWGREVTDLEVFETVAAATGYKNPPVYAPARSGEVQRTCLDAGLALKTWGWRPTVTLREGVDRVVANLRRMQAQSGGQPAAAR